MKSVPILKLSYTIVGSQSISGPGACVYDRITCPICGYTRLPGTVAGKDYHWMKSPLSCGHGAQITENVTIGTPHPKQDGWIYYVVIYPQYIPKLITLGYTAE